MDLEKKIRLRIKHWESLKKNYSNAYQKQLNRVIKELKYILGEEDNSGIVR